MDQFFECPGCGQRYRFTENMAGRQVRCKKCSQVFQIAAIAPTQPAAWPELSNPTGPLGTGLEGLLDDPSLAGAWDAPAGTSPLGAGFSTPAPRPRTRRAKLGRKDTFVLVVGGLLGLLGAVELVLFHLVSVPTGAVVVLALLFALAIATMFMMMLPKRPAVAMPVAGGILVVLLLVAWIGAGVAGAPRPAGSPPIAANPAPNAATAPPAPPGSTANQSQPGSFNPPTPAPGPPMPARRRTTDFVGGAGGMPFELVGEGEPVLGFVYRMGQWAGQDALGLLQPLYHREETMGGFESVIAKAGYAVAGLEVDAGEYVFAVRVLFARLDADGRLDPRDAYKSDWIGSPKGGAVKTLGGDGVKVVGVCGRGAALVDAIALVVE
jgi:predicted Zn finger-like uncharacterized protein